MTDKAWLLIVAKAAGGVSSYIPKAHACTFECLATQSGGH